MSTIGDIDKKYTLTKKIGSGGTSKVYLANKIDNPKELFAVKIIKPNNSNESKVFMNEINVLKKINHNNVVRLVDGGEGVLTKDTGKKYMIQYIVLELIKFGELFDYIFFPQKGFGEEIGKYIFTQLIDGLDSVHKSGICHRDMKTENIMLGEGWQMKIADFGFSTKSEGKKGNGLLYTALGTASYASPELLQKKPYLGVQSDIFSLGVSLFVLVTGKMPFKHALTDDPYYKEICKGNYDNYWAKLESKVPPVSSEFKQLFVSLIAYDANSRPSLEDCRNCKWMKGAKIDLDKINSEFSARTKIVQHKKELERKKEEIEEMEKKKQNGQFVVYKDGTEEVEIPETNNNLEIRDYDEENPNPYIINYPNETSPGTLLDYIYMKISNKNKNIQMKIVPETYKMAIGACVNEKEIEMSGEPLTDTVEGLIEVRRSFDGLTVEINRVLGNKYDYHNLFLEVNKILEN